MTLAAVSQFVVNTGTGVSPCDAAAPAAAPAQAHEGAGKAAQNSGDAASSKPADPAAADKRARKPATQS